MHVRFSMVRGIPVVEQHAESLLGFIDGVVIDPDRGIILAFFVAEPRMFFAHRYVLSVVDIVSWGTVVHILDADRLAEAGEIVRLQPILQSTRTLLGQPIVSKRSRQYMGMCRDIQFSTKTFTLEWLFPRRRFRSGIPIAASDIEEVTNDAIIVRDPEIVLPVVVDELSAVVPMRESAAS